MERFARFVHGERAYYARVVDDQTARLWDAAPWLGGRETDRLVPLRDRLFLAPCEPSKIVCIGRNYRAHAAELGNEVPKEPLVFLKPPSALIGHGAEIVLPPQSERVEYEGELAVVMGARAKNVAERDVAQLVFGYTCANDVTARDLQKRDVQFTRGKGFDTFCPLGPAIVRGIDPTSARIETRVNGVVMQSALVSQMERSVAVLIAFISSVMTLEPGDVVLTGTPEGVGPLSAGDSVVVEIEQVGRLENRARG